MQPAQTDNSNQSNPSQPTVNYKFSQNHKGSSITLSNNNTKAINLSHDVKDQLVILQGPVSKKGSSIRFKIKKVGNVFFFFIKGVAVGMGLKNIISKNSYQIKDSTYRKFIVGTKTGHGCFLLTWGAWSYSHSIKEQNRVLTDYLYAEDDIIKVETNDNQLIFVNETQQWQFKMELTLTQSQWNEACFVVELYGSGDSVSILNMNDKGEQGCGCVIQ